MEANLSKAELHARIDQLEKDLDEYRALLDNSPDLLYRTDQNGIITYISGAVFKISGYTVQEAIGLDMAREIYYYPEERNLLLRQLQEKGYVRNFHARLKRKDGSLWWASTNSHFLWDEAHNVVGVEGITRDITDLKNAEIALRESEEKFRSIIENSPMGVHLYELLPDDRLILIGANQAADRILNVENAHFIGKTIEAAFPQLTGTPVVDNYKAVCRTGRFWQAEQVEYKDERIEGAYEVHAFSTGANKMASFFLDITEKKEAERQKQRLQKLLQQSQKFEAIGTLAGGVAHDFNNLLMGIQGRASLIYMDLKPNHPHMEHISAISDYVRSATELTKQLLGFARGGKYEVKPIDLNDLVQTSSSMFSRTRKEIRLHAEFQEERIVVEADGPQIEQVLLNMYVNAWQAMPTGGDLFLQTAAASLDEQYCAPHQVAPGRYARVSVTDSGIGMSDAVRRQIFDPFFTTKEKSRGTGLGLASSYGIIKNHGGFITVYSEIGRGSTFNIYLPMSAKTVGQEIPSDASVVKGSEMILLVDDEQMVIDVGKAMLEKLGYRVLTAGGGVPALDIVMDHGQDIDLVILDLVMPDMDGSTTFGRIREVRPDIPVLLSSGYAINEKASQVMQQGCNGFIQKPFNISELSQKVRQVLSQGQEPEVTER